MRLQRSLNRIIELMALFVHQIKGNTAMNLQDINRLSETILIPLLSEVYGYRNLRNLNDEEKENYPGIDLADEKAKIAFQITSDPSNDKIKETLTKFVKHELYKKYDRLIVYIITEKQQTYSGKGHQDILKGKIAFDKDLDILDYKDIQKKIKGFQIEKAEKIEYILEQNFGDKNRNFFIPLKQPKTENIFLNLLKITFPNKLYIADLNINSDEVLRNTITQKKILINKNYSTGSSQSAKIKV